MTYPYLRPPIKTATEPVHSAADMGRRWRALMGELGFGERLIWFGVIGPDRRMTTVLHQVPIPREPRRRHVDDLFGLLRGVLEGIPVSGATIALLLTRPGSGSVSEADRRWCTVLTEAADRHGVPIEPIFRANDEDLVLVEPTPEAA